jgi:hypothetical protein
MKSDGDWAKQVKGIMKGELKRRGVTYQQLSDSLKTVGIDESSENIANKISRGKFTAVFMVQCLEVIGCKSVALSAD